MKRGMILLLTIIAFAVTASASDLAVTVYNQNMALVKDQRAIAFEKGRFDYSLTDVPSLIDPTSVHFKLLNNPEGAALLEQNYRYDLVGFAKILERYLDKEIQMIHEDGSVFSGTLLANDGSTVTLMKPSGALEVIRTVKITKFDFPDLPEGLITKPTLMWMFDSEVSGDQNSEISYMTRGMNWHTEYVGVVSEDDKAVDLSAWVSIENNSGATFKDAKLKLVAGDVNFVRDKPRYDRGYAMEDMAMAKAPAGFEEKEFFEYHLYTLPRKTDLSNNEIKQIALFEPATTGINKIYTYSGGADVRVNLEFKNSKENGLGLPMPAGKFRIMKRDSDGAMEFVGEDRIDHTPRDEKISLYLGNAFDLVGERVVKDSRRITDRVREEDVEIKLRNRKTDESVEIVVKQIFGRRDWKILKSNFEYEKINAQLVEFKIPIKVGEEITVTYTVRYE